MKRSLKPGIVFLIIGLLSIISVFLPYRFIHGDYNSYIWIINGPFPLSVMGGGPFQLLMYGGIFVFGVIFLIIGVVHTIRQT